MKYINFKNKKGFTLIELLAVIVILAILILLAMPSVLKIMENAKKNAFVTEAESIIKAAQTQYAENAVNSASPKNCYTVNELPLEKDMQAANYKGFVKITFDAANNKATYTISLTNGTYQIQSKTLEDLGKDGAKDITSGNSVTSNCS